MTICKTLHISIDHISTSTNCWIDEQMSNEIGIEISEKRSGGWFFPVPDKNYKIEYKLPEDLADILDYARLHSCEWILLDDNGAKVNLHVYDDIFEMPKSKKKQMNDWTTIKYIGKNSGRLIPGKLYCVETNLELINPDEYPEYGAPTVWDPYGQLITIDEGDYKVISEEREIWNSIRNQY